MRQTSIRYMGLLSLVLVLLSIGGIFAVWQYYTAPETKAEQLSFEVSGFVWTPEEVLPTETPGQNYMDLLESILNNSKAGLNSSKGTLKNAVLNDKDGLVHSSQNVQGGNLKHLFITEACRLLDFMMEYVADTEFRVYMCEADPVDEGTVGTTRVKVYMTVLAVENGKWIARETQFGYATVQYFPGSSSTHAIGITTWTPN